MKVIRNVYILSGSGYGTWSSRILKGLQGSQQAWTSRFSVGDLHNHNDRSGSASPFPFQQRYISSSPLTSESSTSSSGVPLEEAEETSDSSSQKKRKKKVTTPTTDSEEGTPPKSGPRVKAADLAIGIGEAPSKGMQMTMDYINKTSGMPRKISSLITKKFLRPSKLIPTSVYLVNKSVAAQMAEMIKAENPDLDATVLELHPGLGLLTSELLNNVGFNYVSCFEDNAKLAESIKDRFDISVVDTALDDLPRIHHLDKHDGGERISNILKGVTTQPQEGTNSGRKPLYLIGVLPHVSQLNFMIRCYVTQRVLFDEDTPWQGTFTYFTALGGRPELICNATRETGLVAYRASSVFFQTLFKSKEIGVLPREAFIPWEIQDKVEHKGPKGRKLKVVNPEIIKLFRIEANTETVDKIGKEHLFSYWYFVRQSLYARRARIIPELEKWIPGCGRRLIKQGYTIYSPFGSLQPHEILDLYCQFVSWPDFANSSFLNAVEKFQTRLEISEEEE